MVNGMLGRDKTFFLEVIIIGCSRSKYRAYQYQIEESDIAIVISSI